ncbi:MAG: hypothetical protein ACC682_11485 [Gemmatimonadota bacterium]
MRHLTPEEIERFAAGDSPVAEGSACRGTDGTGQHLARCPDCREEVEFVRALDRCLADLPEVEPTHSLVDAVLAAVDLPIPWLEERLAALPEMAPPEGFAVSVMSRIDLPAPWLDEALARLPEFAPSEGFATAALRRVDLPVPWLDHALARLPRAVPAPGFATSVMARVRLPIPWHQRAWRFARRRRVALAGAAASTFAVSSMGAAWLFGVQGVTPVQFVTFVLGGARDLAVRGLVALGRFGYEVGLVDAGTAIPDVSPTAALGALALVSAVGLLSLLVMARLMHVGPERRLSENA